ncbi:MAG: sporulation integral membrane protein YlbJ [Thermaerobacter sp.]|nr:sporulation integral membrane protein YlbJ [Thermaerobacter sp.]
MRRLATAGVVLALAAAIIAHPAAAFQASVQGLELWWNVVFPALLPFFIVSQLLLGLGVVRALGSVMEPVMRRAFRVPGEGAFVLALGAVSGFPVGAVLTAQLRRAGAISREEAERLVCFANTANPLFMSGAVAVGMFGNAAVAPLIMAAHYLSDLLIGLLLRFHGPGAPRPKPVPVPPVRPPDQPPLGTLLAEAVERSLNTLGLIGGFIVLFAVSVKLLTVLGVLRLPTAALAGVFSPWGLDRPLARALIQGGFEISSGAQQAARAAAPLAARLAVVGAILAWSGLSVLAQVTAVLRGTDLRLHLYLLARLAQAALAAALSLLLYPLWFGRP